MFRCSIHLGKNICEHNSEDLKHETESGSLYRHGFRSQKTHDCAPKSRKINDTNQTFASDPCFCGRHLTMSNLQLTEVVNPNRKSF